MTHRTPRVRVRLNRAQKLRLAELIRDGHAGREVNMPTPYGAKCHLYLWAPLHIPEFGEADPDLDPDQALVDAIVQEQELEIDATMVTLFDKEVQVTLRKAKGTVVMTPIFRKRR